MAEEFLFLRSQIYKSMELYNELVSDDDDDIMPSFVANTERMFTNRGARLDTREATRVAACGLVESCCVQSRVVF